MTSLSGECLKLRRMELQDIKDVVSIEKLSFGKSWSPQIFQRILVSPSVEVWVATQNEFLLGYAVLTCVRDEAELTNIAVREGERNQGIGSTLLSKVLDVAVGRNVENIFLEVRSSNQQAISLYQRFGFHLAGKRKGYYRKPTEDALILSKALD